MKIIFSTIAAIILLFSSCENNEYVPGKAADSLAQEDMPDQVSWDITVYFYDSSFTAAKLQARRARIFQDRQETLLDSGLQVDFYSRKSGGRGSVLTANNARIDDQTGNMLARGDVVVISDSNNTKLETSVLEWNDKTQKLYSTEFVKITSPNEIITGYGFESDQNLTNYTIHKVSGYQRR